MTRTYPIPAVVGACALLLAACGDLGLPDFNVVEGARTLAIRVDPPVVGPGETATFTALTAA